MKQDRDFDTHCPARLEDVEAYEGGQHAGPQATDLHIDMLSGRFSKWNYNVANLIYEEMLAQTLGPDRDKKFWLGLIRAKLDRIKKYYIQAQPKYLDGGTKETPDQAIIRREATRNAMAKQTRQNSRRKTVSSLPSTQSFLFCRVRLIDR